LRPYFAPEGFDYLCQQMGFLHTNVSRIRQNFSIGMTPKD
jgi:hypothetical protein